MLCCARDVCVLFRDMASVCVSEFWTFACCIVGSGKRRCHGRMESGTKTFDWRWTE